MAPSQAAATGGKRLVHATKLFGGHITLSLSNISTNSSPMHLLRTGAGFADEQKALDTIKQSETNEVKALAKPPMGVKIVCEAVCVMLGIKPVRIPDPEDPSKRIMDFWGPSQKMLGEADFIAQLKG